jgi:hypothetical protein
MNVKTTEIVDFMLNKLTDNEVKLIKFLTNELPFRSSMEDDEKYWDIVFMDSKVKLYLEHLLEKYGVKYNVKNITNLYLEKSKDVDKTFINEIDDFIDNILDIDKVLDKISQVGIGNIQKYELHFLERQSKK